MIELKGILEFLIAEIDLCLLGKRKSLNVVIVQLNRMNKKHTS